MLHSLSGCARPPAFDRWPCRAWLAARGRAFLILCVRYKYIFSRVVHVMPFSSGVIGMAGIKLEWTTTIIMQIVGIMVMRKGWSNCKYS